MKTSVKNILLASTALVAINALAQCIDSDGQTDCVRADQSVHITDDAGHSGCPENGSALQNVPYTKWKDATTGVKKIKVIHCEVACGATCGGVEYNDLTCKVWKDGAPKEFKTPDENSGTCPS